MKLKANDYNIKRLLNGEIELTFKIDKESNYNVLSIPKQSDLNGYLSVEIKKWINHRTIDQNSLLWAIETKLANYYNKNVNEVHKENLISYGVPFGQAIMLYENAEQYCKTNYAKIENEKIEKGKKIALFTIYKGSSEMDTLEFSRLVNAILVECKSNGIDVEQNKKDFESLQKEWSNKNEKQKK